MDSSSSTISSSSVRPSPIRLPDLKMTMSSSSSSSLLSASGGKKADANAGVLAAASGGAGDGAGAGGGEEGGKETKSPLDADDKKKILYVSCLCSRSSIGQPLEYPHLPTLFHSACLLFNRIILTGGTIAMSRGPDGALQPYKGFLAEMMASFVEIKHPDVPLYDVLEWEEALDSSDFSPGLTRRANVLCWLLLRWLFRRLVLRAFAECGLCWRAN